MSEKTELMRKAEERAANLPKDFLDWMDRMPPWPEGADEIIGPRTPAKGQCPRCPQTSETPDMSTPRAFPQMSAKDTDAC